MANRSSFLRQLVPLVAILAVFSIPVLGIMQPILKDLVPLAYIVTVFCLGTACGRHLLSHHHRLRMEEIKAGAELARLDTERYQAAERLVDGDDPVERKVREIQARGRTILEAGDDAED